MTGRLYLMVFAFIFGLNYIYISSVPLRFFLITGIWLDFLVVLWGEEFF